MLRIVAFAAIVAVAAALPAGPPPPSYAPAPVYKEEPKPYAYSYAVKDDYSGANYNAGETADGNGNVEGSYSVALPDGRTQNVNYHADDYGGYVADVTYDGVPQYAAVHTVPVVHAAPAYHG